MSARHKTLARAGLLAASVLIVGAAVVSRWVPARRAPAWRLVPDTGEPMRRVACVVNSARRAVLRNADLVTRIVNALPPRARVILLTNDRAAFTVARDPHPGRVELVDLPADRSFTIWPQDPMLVLADGRGARMLLASGEFTRADDRVVAERLAAHLGWSHRVSDLCFEGGNIVAGTEHVFIGADTIRFNALRAKVSDEAIVRRFQDELGRPAIVLGPLPQPVGHIDMAVTPLDGRRLAVADAGWGARLARAALRDGPDAVAAFERSCEEQYFGDRRISTLPSHGGTPIRRPRVVGRTAQAAERTEQVAPHLDTMARELGRWGYEIHRVPLLLGLMDRRDAPASGPGSAPATQPAEDDPAYPCLTYNNVLTEAEAGRRIVYLPQYGWEAMDAEGRRAWEKVGYEVRRVEGLAISAMYGGSLRCCVKVLARGR